MIEVETFEASVKILCAIDRIRSHREQLSAIDRERRGTRGNLENKFGRRQKVHCQARSGTRGPLVQPGSLNPLLPLADITS